MAIGAALAGLARVQIVPDMSGFAAGVGAGTQATMATLGAKLHTFGAGMTKAVTLPALAIGAVSVKAFSDFDSAMTQSIAIMGNVDRAMREKMEKTAREVAKTTSFSAKEAAEAYFFLASAGLDAAASVAAMPQVAAFAQAGMFDMARATDLLTDAQSALGLKTGIAAQDIANMARISDVLVGANTLANASVEEFSTALTSKAGTAMKTFGIHLEDGVAVLAKFADAGVKGEAAGTMYARTLQGLAENARKNSGAFADFGIAVFDSAGVMRPTADIVRDMETAFGDMTIEQKEAAIASLGFNKLAKEGLLLLLGGADDVSNYADELRNMGGVTQTVAEKQLETFSQRMGLMKDRLKDAAITIGGTLAPHIERLAGFITGLVEKFSALSPKTQDFIVKAVMLAAVIGPAVLIGLKLVAMFGKVFKAALLVAKGIQAVTVAMMANPILLLVAAIAAAVILIIMHWDEIKEAFAAAIEFIKDIVGGVIEFFQEFPTKVGEVIEAVGEWFMSLPGRIGEALLAALKALADFIPFAIGWALGLYVKVILAVVGFFAELPGKIWGALLWVLQKMAEFIPFAIGWMLGFGVKVIAAFINFWLSLPGRVWQALLWVVDKMRGWIPKALTWLADFGIRVIEAFIDFWVKLPGRVWQALLWVVARMREWIPKALVWVKDFGVKVIEAWINFWLSLPARVAEIGGKIVAAIRELIGKAFNAMKDFGKKLWEGFKKGMGIGSPSFIERAMDQVLTNMQKGVVGIKDSVSELSVPALGVAALTASGTASVAVTPRTATIIVELDGRTLAKAVGEPLMDEIRVKTGYRG